ncbi:MAG: hypothetical protein KDB84_05250, partial [Flavobacteriales bacterium]|nr:hypothetical protein [Flavobacteriales bacterium]
MRPTLPLLVVLSLFSLPGNAQRLALGLKGGLLASTTHAVRIQTYPVPGATAGIYFPYHAGTRFEIQPEALITLNGSGYQEPDGDRFTARTLYMNFPVSAKLFLGNSFNLQGGVKAGKLLLAYHETAEGNVTMTDRYNAIDFGLTGG